MASPTEICPATTARTNSATIRLLPLTPGVGVVDELPVSRNDDGRLEREQGVECGGPLERKRVVTDDRRRALLHEIAREQNAGIGQVCDDVVAGVAPARCTRTTLRPPRSSRTSLVSTSVGRMVLAVSRWAARSGRPAAA